MSGDVHRVRLDPETHRRLKIVAARRGLSLKNLLALLVGEAYKQEQTLADAGQDRG